MVCEISKVDRSPLLPERHPQQDLFICDIFDAVPKGDIASMEHPVFSLSTKPDVRPRRYERNGKVLEITPSVKGLATVYDRDVLIYCISQVIAALNEGRSVAKTLRFKAHDLLISTNRQTNGQAYEALKAAFERLRGTTISTNIMTGGTEQLDVFGLIDRAKIIRKTRDGRMLDVEITLSDWVFNAIRSNEVLALNKRYFQLRKPLERRLYELARKHCGRQREWRISLETLQEKTGSSSTPKEFKRLINKIIKDDSQYNHMPDYFVSLESEIVIFKPKPEFSEAYRGVKKGESSYGFLKSETYEKAKEYAPSWDIYFLEQEWREWMVEPPQYPDAAFLGFCRKYYERHGKAKGSI